MIWIIVVVLLALWLLGLLADIAGGLINLLLVAAAVVIIYNFVANRR